MRQVHAKKVKLFARREMLDVVIVDGKARGIVCRNLTTGEIERYAADAVLLAGCYGTAYYLSTNAVTRCDGRLARSQAGRAVCEPLLPQSPACIPSAANIVGDLDGKASGTTTGVGEEERRRVRDSPGRARLLLDTKHPASKPGASRRGVAATPATCDDGVASAKRLAVYLDFRDAIQHRRNTIKGNAATSSRCGEDHRRGPVRCPCASTPLSTTRWEGSGWTTT